LGNSGSSVHKKIRCPHCLTPFRTATAVLKHLEDDPADCVQQLGGDPDDISKSTWTEIEREVSRAGFEKLTARLRENIDSWVLNNLDSYALNETVETHKGELRKWYMTWRILFPAVDIPASPCKFRI